MTRLAKKPLKMTLMALVSYQLSARGGTLCPTQQTSGPIPEEARNLRLVLYLAVETKSIRKTMLRSTFPGLRVTRVSPCRVSEPRLKGRAVVQRRVKHHVFRG